MAEENTPGVRILLLNPPGVHKVANTWSASARCSTVQAVRVRVRVRVNVRLRLGLRLRLRLMLRVRVRVRCTSYGLQY